MTDDQFPDEAQPGMSSSATYADDAQRYRLEARIATGGMGEVWRALDTTLGREVAVKLLKTEYAGDPLFRQRFEAEARHAAGLHHPGVAAVYDVGESTTAEGLRRPFLVMELVEGQPLSALLRRGEPLAPDAVRELVTQAADALGAAHVAGIVHRDVKPANLLVTPDRTVKITDFGIARALSSSALTGTGQVMGTPQYLSPEQARGETATPASDVYGLGVVAFECLAGQRPFEKESPVATALAHLQEPVPPLPDDVPADLAAIVYRALAKNPADRFPDAGALAAALRGTGEATTQVVPMPPAAAGVPAAPETQVLPRTTGVPLAGVAAAAAADEPVEDGTEGRDERSRNGALVAVILTAVALLLLLGWWAFGREDDSDGVPAAPVASSTAAEPSPRASRTASPSASPRGITLDESDYLGRDVDTVVAELRDLGLEPDPEAVENPGEEEEGTVADVSPTSGLQEGDTVTVAYFDEPEEQPSEPSPSQRPSQQPSERPTQAASPTQRPSQAASPTQQPEQPSGSISPVASSPTARISQSGQARITDDGAAPRTTGARSEIAEDHG